MLTGDKRETAINVGKACNLVKKDMVTLILSSESKAQTKERINHLMKLVESNNISQLKMENERDEESDISSSEQSVAPSVEIEEGRKPELALVIEGRTLVFALEHDLKFKLLCLAQQCHTVICCRTTPLQKTLVVKLIKESGAPPVAMTPKEKLQKELNRTKGIV